MAKLRKVRFTHDYWHLVNDEDGARQGIIGSLLLTQSDMLPWRAEFAPIWGSVEDMAIGYFRTEEEALDFLQDKLEGK